LSALVSFLSAAAEHYAYRMAPYGPDDDAPWFPAWLQERAYINSDELAMASELDTCPRCPRCGDLTPDPLELCCDA
jgi:hypothetical protein